MFYDVPFLFHFPLYNVFVTSCEMRENLEMKDIAAVIFSYVEKEMSVYMDL